MNCNQIVIRNPDRLKQVLDRSLGDHADGSGFPEALVSLLDIFTSLLGNTYTRPGWQRVATLWHSCRDDRQEFAWMVADQPINDARDAHQCVLAGALVFDPVTRVWGIHT